MDTFFRQFRNALDIKTVDVRTYSPLTLAYIGDSVYDCMIKLFLVTQGNKPVNTLHKLTKEYVKASEQAAIYKSIEPMLKEEELKIFKWGRNAKSQTIPKNADKGDYQMATGFECLLGYLLITESYERLIECIVEGIKNDKTNTETH